VHVISCSPVVAGGFPREKEVIVAELGGQPHQVTWILTFPLSKASPNAYITYRNEILSLLYFKCM
jgi:hypothetical protein